MKAITFALVGLVLGGLFMNEKFSAPQVNESKTEIVYGHRVGQDGNPVLVTTR